MSNEFSFLSYNFEKDETAIINNSSFWEGLNINHSSITNEKSLNQIKSVLLKKNKAALEEIAHLLIVSINPKDTRDDIVDKLDKISNTEKKMILLLDSFASRKATPIKLLYNLIDNRNNSTTLAQLMELFKGTPSSMLDVYTENNWFTRKTGKIYTYKENKITQKKIEQLLDINAKRKHLIDYLYKHTGETKHKIYSYSLNKNLEWQHFF